MEAVEKYLEDLHETWHGSPFSVGIVQRDGPEAAWQEHFFNYGRANGSGRMWDEDVSDKALSVASSQHPAANTRSPPDNLPCCVRLEAFREHRNRIAGRRRYHIAEWEQTRLEYTHQGYSGGLESERSGCARTMCSLGSRL